MIRPSRMSLTRTIGTPSSTGAPGWTMPYEIPRSGSTRRSSSAVSHSPAIPKLPQIGGDGGIQLCGLRLLLTQYRNEPLHVLVKRLAVVLGLERTHITSRRQDVSLSSDLL